MPLQSKVSHAKLVYYEFKRFTGQRLFFLFFLPKIAPSTIEPTFRSRPPRVVGIPVARATFCFTAVTPKARFHENDSPGIFIRLQIDIKHNKGREL